MLIKRGDGDFVRVYRPCTIDEVFGQEQVKTIIKKALDSGKVSHSYLFCGGKGTGKTTFARILALGLNCTNTKKASQPCCECDSCKSILGNFGPDYLEINMSEKTGIGDVRELIKTLGYANFSLKNKVIVLDECHQMSTHAQNALLKPLEDYKEDVYFILCTTEPNKIIPTLANRCTKLVFKRLPVKHVVLALENICEFEGVYYNKVGLDLIASSSESIRDAIVNLQSIMVADKLNDIEWIRSFLGLLTKTEENKLEDLVNALIKKNWAKTVLLTRKFLKDYTPEQLGKKLFELFSYKLAASKTVHNSKLFYILGSAFRNPTYSFSELIFSLFSAIERLS